MRVVVAVVAGLLLLAGCSDDPGAPVDPDALDGRLPAVTTPPPPPEVWPGASWDEAPSGEWADLDAEAAATGSTCVAVVRDGRLVHRWTAPGTDARTTGPVYSVTKSVTALLVAIAVADGDLRLDDAVAEHVPAWRGGPSSDVTVEQLLAMTSGRRWTYDLDYGGMIRRAPDKTAFALGVGQEDEPGSTWEYDNIAVQVLEEVLTSATGTQVRDLARTRLFEPIGLPDTTWDTDAAGSTTTYSGIRSSCDDLARLGLLVARRGAWDGTQVVRADLVDRLTGSSSSELNAAYGGLWWVNAEGRVQTIERAAGFGADRAPYTGQLAPDAPDDARWAIGYGNQLLAVVPSLDVVAVRLGARPGGPDRLGAADLTGRVLDGLG